MKKILIIIGMLLAVAVAYWLISPLWINKEVNESLDPEVQRAIDQLQQETSDTNLDEQLPDKDMQMDMFEDMAKREDESMDESMPPMPEQSEKPVGPMILASGSFVDVAHHGSGDVKIIDLGAEGKILRLENLDILNGPDLRVLLSPNSHVKSADDLGSYIEIDKLKGNKGNQNYILPANIDLSQYQSVIIYCYPFHVVFNAADLIR